MNESFVLGPSGTACPAYDKLSGVPITIYSMRHHISDFYSHIRALEDEGDWLQLAFDQDQ